MFREYFLVLFGCSVLLLSASAADVDKFASWFNDQTEEVIDTAEPLQVVGKIPEYIDGELLRLGPSVIRMKNKNYTNMLDSFGRITSWSLSGKKNKAEFKSAIIKSQLWNNSASDETISRHITQEKTEPATSPGIFDLSWMDNTDVNIYKFKGSEKYITFTDFYLLNEIHVESLRTIGSVQYDDSDDFPKGGFFSSSHPVEYTHPETDEVYLINWLGVKTARGSTIYVYSLDKNMVRTVVGSVDIGFLPYSIHSVALVGNYVSVVVAPVSIDFLKTGVNLCLSCSYKDHLDSEPTNIFVFSLTDVGNGRENRYSDPVVTVEVPSPDAFFVFHHVNGWIRAEDNVMVMDMCSYDDMNGVLGENVIGNLADLLDPDVRNNMEYLCDSIRRVEIQLPCEENIPELVETKTVSPLSNNILPVIDNTGKKYRLEFLTVNPSYRGRHSCFTYGISYHVGELERYEDTGLVKINTCEAEAFNHSYPSVVDVFHMDDVYLGEPIFVPDPKGLDEDSGALLVVTMNGAVGQTTLMVLDAKSLDVMATIDAPFPLMFEFHGEFFPSND